MKWVHHRPLFIEPIKASCLMLATLLAVDGFVFAMLRLAGLSIQQLGNVTPHLEQFHSGFLCLAAGTWAFARFKRVHPLLNARYAAWLATTPWQPGKHLPLGPVHWVWEDAIFFIAATGIAYATRSDLVPCLAVFVGICALISLSPIIAANQARLLYVMAFLGFAIVLLWQMQSEVVVLLLLIALLINLGNRRSVLIIPWKLNEEVHAKQIISRRRETSLLIGPTLEPQLLARLHKVTLPVLVGWATFCVVSRAMLDQQWNHAVHLTAIILFATLIGSAIRWGIYCATRQPPISLWGRLLTGRWLMPGYDHVLLTPLLALLVPPMVYAGLFFLTVAPAYAAGICLCVLLFIMLNGRPSLRRWELTGHYRYLPRQRTATTRAN